MVLFWKNFVKLEVVDSHRNYIDAVINGGMEDVWRFTGFYGKPDTARRGEAWDKLRSLNRGRNIPWLCVRDFNEITSQDEKLGGSFEEK